MNRRFLLLLTTLATGLVLMIGLIRIIASAPGAQPAGWQSATQAYMRYQATKHAIQLEIAAAEEAGRPWEFRRTMSGRSFGESTYYQVSTPYSGVNGAMPPAHAARCSVVCAPENRRRDQRSGRPLCVCRKAPKPVQC